MENYHNNKCSCSCVGALYSCLAVEWVLVAQLKMDCTSGNPEFLTAADNISICAGFTERGRKKWKPWQIGPPCAAPLYQQSVGQAVQGGQSFIHLRTHATRIFCWPHFPQYKNMTFSSRWHPDYFSPHSTRRAAAKTCFCKSQPSEILPSKDNPS